jgi:hypothetical protein
VWSLLMGALASLWSLAQRVRVRSADAAARRSRVIRAERVGVRYRRRARAVWTVRHTINPRNRESAGRPSPDRRRGTIAVPQAFAAGRSGRRGAFRSDGARARASHVWCQPPRLRERAVAGDIPHRETHPLLARGIEGNREPLGAVSRIPGVPGRTRVSGARAGLSADGSRALAVGSATSTCGSTP